MDFEIELWFQPTSLNSYMLVYFINFDGQMLLLWFHI